MAMLMRSRDARRFPGAQPISFKREHLQTITNSNYMVSEKADGMRYLVYSGLNDEERTCSFLVSAESVNSMTEMTSFG